MTVEKPCVANIDDIKTQASRCLNCKNPSCVNSCPVGQNIPKFLSLVKAGQYQEAYKEAVELNPLAGICGQICPHEKQCSGHCVLGKKTTPVNMGNVEAFVFKHFRQEFFEADRLLKGKNIAVVGSGAAGLAAAWFLKKHSATVTVYEKNKKLGGILTYGIPSFRLDKSYIDDVISDLKKADVKFFTNTEVGVDISLREISSSFDAVFLATGLQEEYTLDIDGENFGGVVQGIEFLKKANEILENCASIQPIAENSPQHSTKTAAENLAKALAICPTSSIENVIVVGGGNTAIDCARTAKRFFKNVTLAYRRTETEMPALKSEIQQAKEEGINFEFLLTPAKVNHCDNLEQSNHSTRHCDNLEQSNHSTRHCEEGGFPDEAIHFCINKSKSLSCVTSLEFQVNTLGQPDADGRRKFLPTQQKITLPCDLLIVGIGSFLQQNPFENCNIQVEKGRVICDENFNATPSNIYVGGDILNRQNTVSAAVYDAKRACQAIVDRLKPQTSKKNDEKC